MIVYGEEIPQQVIRAVTKRMRSAKKPFRFWDVQMWLVRHGVSASVRERAADRLLQSERKAGHVRFQAGVWVPCQVASK